MTEDMYEGSTRLVLKMKPGVSEFAVIRADNLTADRVNRIINKLDAKFVRPEGFQVQVTNNLTPTIRAWDLLITFESNAGCQHAFELLTALPEGA